MTVETTTAIVLDAYYEVLQSGAAAYDPGRMRSILAEDLEFDGPIAGQVQGAERFARGVAGFIETQRGITVIRRVVMNDEAAVLYDAELPGGTVRFAEFFRVAGGRIQSIKLLYDPATYAAFGGR